jgi:AcrR family transcriptional regulator
MPREGTRGNQRMRTRKDLLRAAAELLREGRRPSMEEIAEKALVSRATAYRYFPSLETLLIEAPLDGEAPSGVSVFGKDSGGTAEERIDRAEAAMHAMTYRNERQLRLMLAQFLLDSAGPDPAAPRRQNRRTELIEAALAPVKPQMSRQTYERLCAALALVFGTESMIVLRDVVSVSEKKARGIKSWAARALVRSALAEPRR